MRNAMSTLLEWIQTGKLTPEEAQPIIEALTLGNRSQAQLGLLTLVSQGRLAPEEALNLLADTHAAPEAPQAPPPPPPPSSEESEAHYATGETPPPPPPPHGGPFSGIAEAVEKIGKEIATGVNWTEVGEQIKTSAAKVGESLRSATDQLRKEGKFGFFFGETVQRDIVLPLEIGEGKSLKVESVAGDVVINCTGEKSEVRVSGRFRGDTKEAAQLRADEYTLMIEESDHVVTIRQPDLPGLEADLTIELPMGVAVDLRGTSGDLHVIGSKGNTRVVSQSGDIMIRQAEGTAELELRSGSIVVQDSQLALLTIDQRSGDIHVSNTEASFDLRTSSGDIVLDKCRGKTLSLEATTGDIRADLDRAIDGTVTMHTTSGTIDVAIATGSNCRVKMSTLRGDALSSIELADMKRENGLITGVLGEGQGSLDLSATNGDLLLRYRAEY